MRANSPIKLLFALAVWAASTSAFAYDWKDGFNLNQKGGDRYALILSPYSYHFSPSDEHKDVWLVGLMRERADGALAGAAFFSNSFGQSSVYIFPFGKIYRGIFDQPQLYAKLTAGLLYGYRGKYEDKVPFNSNGFSPGIVPALGWQYESGYQAQVNLLGNSGVMLQLSVPLR
jgi:hypothetical protein